jgi:hypothetical protein
MQNRLGPEADGVEPLAKHQPEVAGSLNAAYLTRRNARRSGKAPALDHRDRHGNRLIGFNLKLLNDRSPNRSDELFDVLTNHKVIHVSRLPALFAHQLASDNLRDESTGKGVDSATT